MLTGQETTRFPASAKTQLLANRAHFSRSKGINLLSANICKGKCYLLSMFRPLTTRLLRPISGYNSAFWDAGAECTAFQVFFHTANTSYCQHTHSHTAYLGYPTTKKTKTKTLLTVQEKKFGADSS